MLLHLRVCSFFRTSRWLPCRSGGDRKEPGRPAVDPRKGAGPQVKRNQSSDNACCNVSLLPHIVAKAQIEKNKRFQNPLERIFTVKSITDSSGSLPKLILHTHDYGGGNTETLNGRCSREANISYSKNKRMTDTDDGGSEAISQF